MTMTRIDGATYRKLYVRERESERDVLCETWLKYKIINFLSYISFQP